jgi:hypothetical protein
MVDKVKAKAIAQSFVRFIFARMVPSRNALTV